MGKTIIALAAVIAFGYAVALWFGGNTDAGLFVGIWVPSILALGSYIDEPKRRR